MAWFKKARKPIAPAKDKASRVPEGLWVKCPDCSQIIYNKDLATNLSVCPKCAHHFRVSAPERLKMLLDGVQRRSSLLDGKDGLNGVGSVRAACHDQHRLHDRRNQPGTRLWTSIDVTRVIDRCRRFALRVGLHAPEVRVVDVWSTRKGH